MICGGRISGKSASGSPDIAISPVITVRSAIPIATIGRLIKKFEIIYLLSLFLPQRRKGAKKAAKESHQEPAGFAPLRRCVRNLIWLQRMVSVLRSCLV